MLPPLEPVLGAAQPKPNVRKTLDTTCLQSPEALLRVIDLNRDEIEAPCACQKGCVQRRKALLPTYPPSGTAMSTVKKMPRRIMLDTASIPAVPKNGFRFT